GITGTNAHAVVAGVDGHGVDRDLAADTAEGREHRPPEYVVALSARTPEALTEAAGPLRDWLRAGEDSVRIEDLAYTTTSRREHREQRLAVVAANVEGVLAGLDEHTGTEAGGRAISGVADVASPPR